MAESQGRKLNQRFRVEGTITIGLAFVGYGFTLPFPDQLLASEKLGPFSRHELEIVLGRVERDRGDAEPDPLTKKKVARLMFMWELWVYGEFLHATNSPLEIRRLS